MTKTLTLDEMLDVIQLMGRVHDAAIFTRQLEAVGDAMAAVIADGLNVTYGPTKREKSEVAGTCATFLPSFDGQPCPEPLDLYDATEWED